jgi:MFS family permease
MPAWLETFSTGFKNPDTNKPDITAGQSSLIVSILSAGTFFGALAAAPLADFIGRGRGLMVTLVVFSFGVILQTASVAIPLFVAGRCFAGLGVGLISALSMLASSECRRNSADLRVVPLYQSETAPK